MEARDEMKYFFMWYSTKYDGVKIDGVVYYNIPLEVTDCEEAYMLYSQREACDENIGR